MAAIALDGAGRSGVAADMGYFASPEAMPVTYGTRLSVLAVQSLVRPCSGWPASGSETIFMITEDLH